MGRSKASLLVSSVAAAGSEWQSKNLPVGRQEDQLGDHRALKGPSVLFLMGDKGEMRRLKTHKLSAAG